MIGLGVRVKTQIGMNEFWLNDNSVANRFSRLFRNKDECLSFRSDMEHLAVRKEF